MNLGEFYIAVRSVQGSDSISDAPIYRMYLSFALQELAGIAADVGGPRMLYPFEIDLQANRGDYKLPQLVRAVKGVERLDVRNGAYPLTPLSFTQRAHDQETGFSYGEGVGAFDGYWIANSTLHITPAPGASEPAGLRVWAYAAPPVPQDEGEPLPVPEAALPWVIAKTAEMANPPMQMLPFIERIVEKREKVLRRWMHDVVKDVPPGVAAEGILE